MNELETRKMMVMNTLDATYLPNFSEEKLRSKDYHKYPLVNIAALGVGFQPLISVIQSVAGICKDGTSGVYYVNTKGKQMMNFKNNSDFLGTLATESGTVGGGQARITPLKCDPTTLFMAVALMNIERKLDNIYELQQDMMDFLREKERAGMRGNINTLTDVLNSYKYNWDNEKYKTNKHILVQDVKKEAEERIQLYYSDIKKKSEKNGFVQGNREIKSKLQKIQEDFKDYKLALYLYSFSSFLEVMLLENFDGKYLESVIQNLQEYSFKYRELYTYCYNQIEDMSRSSIQSLVVKGVSKASKGAAEVIDKVPIVRKGLIDETLFAGNKIDEINERKTEKTMSSLIECAVDYTLPFVENLRTLEKIYNEPMEILFDENNLYFIEDYLEKAVND